MPDDTWWQNDPFANRTGYIPGTPKPKDPLDEQSKRLEIRSKELSIAKSEQDLAKPDGGEKLTEGERKAGSFIKRGLGAYKAYEALGLGPRGMVNNTINEISPTIANSIPTAIGGNDPARQQAEAAQNEFLTAILRQDSGATITPDELASQRDIYFPRVGETSPEVLESKRQARLRALQGLLGASGGGVDPETAAAVQALMQGPQEGPASFDSGHDTRVFQPGQNEAHVSTNGSHTEDIPELAGANARLNQMLKAGANPAEIAAYLQSVNIPPAQLMPQVLKIKAFQKQNPGYQGDYFVNVDDRIVANSGLQNIASSALGAYGIAAGDTLTGGHLDNIVGATGGNADLANIGIQESRANNQLASLAGDVTGGALLYGAGGAALRGAGLAGNAAAETAAFAPRALAGDAGMGAYVSSGQGGTQIADPVSMAQGAVLGSLGGAAGRGVINTGAAAVSPSGGALAPLFKEGVRPTIGQRAGGIVNRAEQAFTSIPGVGGIQRAARGAAIDEMQRGAFNQALREIGTELPKGVQKGTQAHGFAQKAFDEIYDKARAGMQFAADDQLADDIGNIAQDAGLLVPQSQAILKKISDDIGSKLNASGGVLSGEQYKIVMSRIGNKIASLRSNQTGDAELASVLDSVRTAIDNAARRQSSPEAVALLDAADRGYAKMVVIENAAKARGGEPGEFSGVGLDRAVQTTDKSRRSRAYISGHANMQEYGSAARRLGDNVADSGTAERILTNGGMAAAVPSISPMALAPWAIDTVATLPGVRQTLGALMSPRRSEELRAAADQIRLRAYLGGLLAAPAAAEGQ